LKLLQKTRPPTEAASRKGPTVLHTLMNDPKVWRDRAEVARAVAEQMTKAEARDIMFRIAAGYDLVAAWAEKGPLKEPKEATAG
jgi:hypothetical protein